MAISTYKTFLMKAPTTYALTQDTAIQVGKTYYTRTGTEGAYVYTPVANPVVGSLGTYYEVTGAGTYTKFLDIKDFSDLGGKPNMLDITTLSDNMTKNMNGIIKLDGLEFTANYTKGDYQACKAVEGEECFWAVWFGGTGTGTAVTPTGSDGKFTFKGVLSAWPVGGGVDEVVDLKLSIANTTVIDFE